MTNVALDLDDRSMPKPISLPRGRRRQPTGAPDAAGTPGEGAATSGARGTGGMTTGTAAAAAAAATATTSDTPAGNVAAV